jgi:putative transposase
MTEHHPPRLAGRFGEQGASMKERKYPVHFPPVEKGNRPIIIFLTLCTDKRKRILASDEAAALLIEAWQAADHWLVGRYIILPDHLHLFCAPDCADHLPLKRWVTFWKSHVARRWPLPEQQPIWQQDFWHTQLRLGQPYGEKWEYVRNNAVRHKLVATADEWPYQGELNVLRWHDP